MYRLDFMHAGFSLSLVLSLSTPINSTIPPPTGPSCRVPNRYIKNRYIRIRTLKWRFLLAFPKVSFLSAHPPHRDRLRKLRKSFYPPVADRFFKTGFWCGPPYPSITIQSTGWVSSVCGSTSGKLTALKQLLIDLNIQAGLYIITVNWFFPQT